MRTSSRTLTLHRLAAAAVLAGATLLPTLSQAGDFLVRARAVNLDPSNGGDIPGLAINQKWIPEVDLSYFVTPHVALELVATYPQRQTVTLNGTRLGTLRHLPPTLLAQYHFMPNDPVVRPYVGAGLNHTHFSAVNLNEAPGVSGDVQRNSTGMALQIGADFPIGKQLSLNLDVKKVDIRTRVSVNGADAGLFKVDPTLWSVGVGYRF